MTVSFFFPSVPRTLQHPTPSHIAQARRPPYCCESVSALRQGIGGQGQDSSSVMTHIHTYTHTFICRLHHALRCRVSSAATSATKQAVALHTREPGRRRGGPLAVYLPVFPGWLYKVCVAGNRIPSYLLKGVAYQAKILAACSASLYRMYLVAQDHAYGVRVVAYRDPS